MSSIYEEFENMDSDIQDIDENDVIDATDEEAVFDAMCGLMIEEAAEYEEDDDSFEGWD